MNSTQLEALKEHEVLTGILPSIANNFKSSGDLIVDYGKKNVKSEFGNELLPSETASIPSIIYKPTQPLDLTATYTLVLTDPDAPSRLDQKWGEYCHYVANGIRFESANGGEISKLGDVRLPYVGPGPPKDTGLHRYIFLLFKEPTDKKSFTQMDRINWGFGTPATGVEKWLAENGNGFELLAVNFFLAQNEENSK